MIDYISFFEKQLERVNYSRLACRKFVAFKWALGIDVLAVACIVIQFLLPIT